MHCLYGALALFLYPVTHSLGSRVNQHPLMKKQFESSLASFFLSMLCFSRASDREADAGLVGAASVRVALRHLQSCGRKGKLQPVDRAINRRNATEGYCGDGEALSSTVLRLS